MTDKKDNLFKEKKNYIYLALCIIILIGVFIYFSNKTSLEVEVFKPEIGNIDRVIELEAKIQSKEEANIYSLVEGRVEKINYQIGDLVNEGDLLVELNKEDIKEEIKKLNEYIMDEEEKTSGLKNQVTIEEVQEKSLKVEKIEAELKEIDTKEVDAKVEYEAGIISLEDYQLIYELKLSKENEYETAKRDFQMANRALIQNMNIENISKINELKLQKNVLEKEMEKFNIKSKVDGIILDMDIELGEDLDQDKLIIVVGKIENVFLEAVVDNNYVDKLENDMEVDIIITGDPIEKSSDSDEKIILGEEKIYETGRIGEILIDKLKLEIGEEGAVNIRVYNSKILDYIGPNKEFSIGITVDQKENTMLIDDYLLFEENKVYIMENSKARLKDIELGIRNGKGQVEVIGGLEKDDLIINPRSPDIKPGIRVKTGL